MINTQALIGTVLGTCTLQKLIGQGSIGTVFLAQQSHTHRQVAVKVLLPETSLTPNQWPVFLERFRKETPALSSLKHQHILPVYESGEQDGLAYLVMPYISGGTLQDSMERAGPLAWLKIVTYLDQLAAALDFAHERGILHQNIRPANILLAPEGHLLLTDFGLMKMVAEKEALRTRLIKSSAPVEALQYVAPEQVMGDSIGVHTDLYALGVVLYQMVTGKTPFQGETATQMARQLVQASPPLPRQLRPDLPVAAEQVVLRAMAKRPPDRYAHAQNVASAFRVALTAAGTLLDSPQGATSAAAASTSAHLFAPRPRGLFDPVWQKAEGEVIPPIGNTPGNGLRKSKPTSVLPAAEMLTPPPAGAFSAPAASTNDQSRPKTTGLLSTIRKTPLLPAVETSLFENEQRESETTATLPAERNTPFPSMRPRLGPKTKDLQPIPQTDHGNPGTTDTLSATKPVSDPPSPFPYTTGAWMVQNSEEGKPGTIKLTEAVKVVQVPVAGQPGRYVTGLLPVSPPASSTQQLEEPLLTAKLVEKWSDLKKHRKSATLAAFMLLVLLGSTFLFLHARPGPTSKNGIHTEHIKPNMQAILAARATATATANVILTDPLNRNIHNWPVAPTGYGVYVFKNGAYHITDNDANKSAPAILPDEILQGSMTYTLTMQEIRGDDSSMNNSFGMILRFNSQAQNGRDIVTFYSFEVLNNPGGEYQFWKYDNSKGTSLSPWSAIWQQPFGGEFHQGQGPQSINTMKVLVSGKYFTFIVNGVKVGTTQDSSFTSGEVGMLVNLQGTEVAFSNLKLTYT